VSIETAQSGLGLAVLDALPEKTIILGVLDLSTDQVEAPDLVAERIARAFPHAGAERLIAAPDCGMKYLPRDAAYGKLEALVEGARLATAGTGAVTA
jgi:5-methyltetrahydropteroyltriglutamate--homocysteine methyltransferase